MKTYDMECPCCGWLNQNLFLEETGGWMECEYCSSVTMADEFRSNTKKDKKQKHIWIGRIREKVC